MNRILSVTQARSQYLKKLAESKRSGTTSERIEANRQMKHAVRALQQAQMRQRLGGSRRIIRQADWNEELT